MELVKLHRSNMIIIFMILAVSGIIATGEPITDKNPQPKQERIQQMGPRW